MKILAINGSPHAKGNTADMLLEVLNVCEKAGIQVEMYQAGGRLVRGCAACGTCRENPGKCAIDDWMNELYLKMKEADAILLGSPTYFSDLTPEIKAVMDRCGYMAGGEGKSLSRKVGAAVSVARRAGSIHALDSMQHFFLINNMIVPGSSYWNLSLSRDLGEFEKDAEGVATMKKLGENIVWLLEKISK